MTTLTILIIIVGLFAWTLRPKKTNQRLKIKLESRFSPRQPIIVTEHITGKDVLLMPDMILVLYRQDKKNYYFSVRCNFDLLWSEKELKHAEKGDIVEVGKDLINKFKMK